MPFPIPGDNYPQDPQKVFSVELQAVVRTQLLRKKPKNFGIFGGIELKIDCHSPR